MVVPEKEKMERKKERRKKKMHTQKTLTFISRVLEEIYTFSGFSKYCVQFNMTRCD